MNSSNKRITRIRGIKGTPETRNLITGIRGNMRRISRRSSFAGIFTISLGILFISLLLLGPVSGIYSYYPGDFFDSQNRLYLLSAIAQSLASILALGITATLVSVQLVSQMFTPKIIRLALRNIYFWLFITLNIATISWAFILMGWLKKLKTDFSIDTRCLDTALLLAGASLLFIIPFIQSTIKNLQPIVFIRKFQIRGDFEAVEEAMHSAVDKGFSTIIRESANAIKAFVLSKTAKEDDKLRRGLAEKVKHIYSEVAVRAFQKSELDSLSAIMQSLKELTYKCVERAWKQEAELFNEALTFIYDSIQEENPG